MKKPRAFPSDFSESRPPFKNGDVVYVHHNFSNGVGGKRAIVENLAPDWEMTSGWAVKIDKYNTPIDSGWLTKIPD